MNTKSADDSKPNPFCFWWVWSRFGKKTPGGAGTHTGHAGAHGHTDSRTSQPSQPAPQRIRTVPSVWTATGRRGNGLRRVKLQRACTRYGPVTKCKPFLKLQRQKGEQDVPPLMSPPLKSSARIQFQNRRRQKTEKRKARRVASGASCTRVRGHVIMIAQLGSSQSP